MPHLVWDATGIGRVLWRGVWVIPVAALVGAVVTAVPRGPVPGLEGGAGPALRVVLVAWGSPVWDAGTVKSRPSWKRPPGSVPRRAGSSIARRPGDVVLAPQQVAQTVLIMSDEVTTVSPRVFYTLALEDEPEAHVEERLLLQSILEPELVQERRRERQSTPTGAEVAQALEAVGVDIACAADRMPERSIPGGRGPIGLHAGEFLGARPDVTSAAQSSCDYCGSGRARP